MKNILIPTDFSIASLKLISAAVKRFPGEQLNIILVHALVPDNSISGLLMLNKRLRVHELYNDAFTDACEVLRNKYASVLKKLKVEFYYGQGRAYLNNFLQGHNVEAVMLADDYVLQMPSDASRDLYPELMRSSCRIFREQIQTAGKRVTAEADSLSALLPA